MANQASGRSCSTNCASHAASAWSIWAAAWAITLGSVRSWLGRPERSLLLRLMSPWRNERARRSPPGLRSPLSMATGRPFVARERCRRRQRRGDPPIAGLARVLEREGTARLSDDDECRRRNASREAPRARRVQGGVSVRGLVL